MSRHSNPFSTRFVRPGAIAFLFEEGCSAEALVERLQANRWLGEIIGPHGTGKSTLLEALKPALEEAGKRVVHLKLTAGRPKLSAEELLGGRWDRQTLVIVDGYEQLRFLSRCALGVRRKLAGAGMLITAHRSAGFPLLYETRGSELLAQRLVEQLTQGNDELLTRDDVVVAMQASRGNVRDALFRLYDLYESRKVEQS
jgi:energy-coupling factor transporter ATP-binding protein EcfA2